MAKSLMVLVEKGDIESDYSIYVPSLRMGAMGDTIEEALAAVEVMISDEVKKGKVLPYYHASYVKLEGEGMNFMEKCYGELDFTLLKASTSNDFVHAIQSIVKTFEGFPMEHARIEKVLDFIAVDFVLCDCAHSFQYDIRTGTFSHEYMSLHAIKYFQRVGALNEI